MPDLHNVGGLPVNAISYMKLTVTYIFIYFQVVMKELLTAGLIHGDCMTVTGKTIAENLSSTPSLSQLNQVYNYMIFYVHVRCCFPIIRMLFVH